MTRSSAYSRQCLQSSLGNSIEHGAELCSEIPCFKYKNIPDNIKTSVLTNRTAPDTVKINSYEQANVA